MNEREMYPIIEAFLKEQGYKTFLKQRFNKTEISADIGQSSIELDVIGFKDDVAWITECKVPCTIEKFGWALGQLICYKFILDGLLKEKTTKYSVVLPETEEHPLTDGLLETFKTILDSNNLKFGLLIANEKSKEVKEPIQTWEL